MRPWFWGAIWNHSASAQPPSVFRILRLLEAPCCSLVAGNIPSIIIPGFSTAPTIISSIGRQDLKLYGLPDPFSDVSLFAFARSSSIWRRLVIAIISTTPFTFLMDGLSQLTFLIVFSDFNRGKAGWFCCTSYWCDYEVSRVYDTHLNRFEITDPLGQIHSLVLLQGWPMTQFCTNQRWCCGEENYEHDLVIQLVPIKLSNFYNLSKPCFFRTDNGWNYVLIMLIQALWVAF